MILFYFCITCWDYEYFFSMQYKHTTSDI